MTFINNHQYIHSGIKICDGYCLIQSVIIEFRINGPPNY